MCWSALVRGDYVYLGYESGHIVLFDRRDLSKQVTTELNLLFVHVQKFWYCALCHVSYFCEFYVF